MKEHDPTHVVPRIGKLIETESSIKVQVLGGVRKGELLFNGYRIWDDEKILEMDSNDGYTTL